MKVFATGDAGRRLVQDIYRKPRHKRYTIARINHLGEVTGLDRGGKTLTESKKIACSILTSQRYTDISFGVK